MQSEKMASENVKAKNCISVGKDDQNSEIPDKF